ncbi:hypothetical protein HYG81_06935 [Natrinema zhouii]|uniref:Uncharacterized protein n=1 Tax=Natrinema zhouii TaxID=1710539 RepID=A0A7D6CS27_9EURY|nr:hypothetical protein [Natrinema zhouii]QLK27329.1 hypothetical protein HYG81_06935 [Natrinema zhouii]
MTGLDRRTVLGSIGTGVLGATAGCLEFFESDDPRRRFEADELAPILAMDRPEIKRPAPVQPNESSVGEAIVRLDELIDVVPEPLEADDVPNEAVRDEIDRTHEIARARRDALEDSSDRFHALQRSVVARRYAGEAAVAIEAVRDERTLEDVESERDDVRTRIENRRAAVDHVGDDVQRTLLLEHCLESELEIAEWWLDNRPRDGTSGTFAVGSIGGVVERARAAVSFAEELERRHEERLEDERSFESRFETALERSLDAIEEANVPNDSTEPTDLVDAEVSETIAERVLLEGEIAVVNASEQTTDAATNDETSTALWYACAFERDRRALETIRERIEDGAHRSLETADDARTVRESALESAADVPFEPEESSLGGDHLADGYEQLGLVDSRIRGAIDDGWRTELFSEYADYVVIGAQLEALPEAIVVLEDRLEA